MSPRRQRWGLGFLAWTLLVLLSISQSAVAANTAGRVVDWGRMVPWRFIDWYSCALFTPAFFWLARRYPIGRQQWARNVPIHLGAAAVATVLKFTLEHSILSGLLQWTDLPLGRLIVTGFISENIAFWCVIAAVHAIEFHGRVREREVLTSRLQARLSEAQLEALTARLHPHFLFNTLQGISTLVYRDPAAADAMLGHLSTLLRGTLQRATRHEVTLADELALLEEYLAIVQVRFGDRVTIERRIEPGTLPGLVPHFVLQPLVENAIEHGIAARAGAGRIEIAAERQADRLLIRVTDDGPGLPSSTASPPDGVGLGSTRRRLAELYGASARLELNGRAGGGTTARLDLPFHEAPREMPRTEPVPA